MKKPISEKITLSYLLCKQRQFYINSLRPYLTEKQLSRRNVIVGSFTDFISESYNQEQIKKGRKICSKKT